MSGPTKDPARMSVTLTVSELEAIVERAVAAALKGMSKDDRLLTVEQVCETLNSKPEWIYHNVKRLPFVRKIGGMLRFSSNDLQRWIAAQSSRHHDQEVREGRLKVAYIYDSLSPSSRKGGDNGKHKKNGKGEKDDDLSGRKRARSGQALRRSVADLAGGVDTPGVGSISQGPIEKGGAAMRERGSGCIFDKPGSRFKWISYCFGARLIKNPRRSTDEKVARKLLRQRLSQVTKDDFIDPAKSAKWILTDMLEVIRQDYEREQKRSFECVKDAFKHLINDTFQHQGSPGGPSNSTGCSISRRSRSTSTPAQGSRLEPPGHRSITNWLVCAVVSS